MTTNAQLDAPGELADDGNIIYPNMAAVTYGYDATGVYLTTSTLIQYGNTYVQTYTYSASNKLASIGLWVKQ